MNEQEKALQAMQEFYQGLAQQLGEKEFKALLNAFAQSKSKNVKMAKKGTKLDSLIGKFANGGPTKVWNYNDTQPASESDGYDRRALLKSATNGRIVVKNPDGSMTYMDAINYGPARYERLIEGPDTTYVVFPNGSSSPRIDIYGNNGYYNDIYGTYRELPIDSIRMLTDRINKKLNR